MFKSLVSNTLLKARFLLKLALLLFIFVRLFGGNYFLSLAVKEFHRELFIEKCKSGFISSHLKRIILSSGDYKSLKWVNEEEFYLNGIMHDLVKTELLKDNSLLILCVSDENETMALNTLEDKNNDQTKEKPLKKCIPDEYLVCHLTGVQSISDSPSHDNTFYCSVKKPIGFLNSFLLPPEIAA